MLEVPRNIVKPSRYAGNEPNAVRNRRDKTDVRFALCYPDIYDIGMSYYGFFLLYEIANRLDGVWCERCFAPWQDMEEHLRRSGQPLFTLESRTPLSQMDLVGFSLSYELNITNVLNMLSLSGIPIRADRREGRHPIIICGGPLTLNPKPFDTFFDLVVIGEGEEVLENILQRYRALKGLPRDHIIQELAGLEGVYAPLTGPDKAVKRLYIEDLDGSYHALRPPIPVVGSVHNRLNIEISRGCGNGCRFCMAGYGYRPYRERSVGRLTDIIDRALDITGYEELSFLSLSAGDYSSLGELIEYVKRAHPTTSISLPSLKIGSISEEEIRMLGEGARGGFTFAVEAASHDLRKRLNKDIDVETLLRQLPLLRACGWRNLKLYLMVGFPWETEEDLRSVRQITDPCLKAGIEVNLSVSPFTPKPHTPFERLGVEDEAVLRSKIDVIKKSLPNKRVKVKIRDIETSLVEALIARGDHRLHPLFEHLHEKGVRLEAWSEKFSIAPYREWFHKNDLGFGEFLSARSENTSLPWKFIDTGIDHTFLRMEMERAERGELTIDCHRGCAACGLACRAAPDVCQGSVSGPANLSAATRGGPSGDGYETYTLRYAKFGDARYIGHLDAMSLLVRALKAAGMRLKMHGRYHPKPRMALSPALPVGIESTCELLEVEAEPIQDPHDMLRRITRSLPGGMRALELRPISMRGMNLTFQYILVGGEFRPEGADLWRNNRDKRAFYLWSGANVKELWVTGSFERIIKVDNRRIDGIRTRNQRDVQRNEDRIS
ncbi:MAG TPA: TIGR03960 family radical SAM protein [Deltaproteobacteria bacterium]|nr:TIGR03960 family radical SAM protein [Deltaproteobacteria bacterium]